jgi:hypothetical protein
MNPSTILSWHLKAGKACAEHLISDPGIVGPVLAEEIARCDPHAAQHAETVRLLREAIDQIENGEQDTFGLTAFEVNLCKEARAHLAQLRGEKGTP